MRVLSINMGADTGGQMSAIGHAFAGVPGWTWRWLVSSLNYIDYPTDLPWELPVIRQSWREAQVVHLSNNWATVRRLERGYKSVGRLPARPLVITYHGTGFREDPLPLLDEQRARGALGTVSTLDLWLLAPDDVTWLPQPIDPTWIGELAGEPRPKDGTFVIAHAPTNRAIKNTEDVIRAVESLNRRGQRIELRLIEGVTWQESLAGKLGADLYIDQLGLGYGVNALEAWAMGIPVIAGAAPATLVEMRRRFGSLPFAVATPDTLEERIAGLMRDRWKLEQYGVLGEAHVRRWHSPRRVVELLQGLYRRAALG